VSSANQKSCIEDYISGGGDAGRPVDVGGVSLNVSKAYQVE